MDTERICGEEGQADYDFGTGRRRCFRARNYTSSHFPLLAQLKNYIQWKYIITSLLAFTAFLLIIFLSIVSNHNQQDGPARISTRTKTAGLSESESEFEFESEPEPRSEAQLGPQNTLNVSWINYLRSNYSRVALRDAVNVGVDNSFDVFVVRTFYEDEWIPGKLIHHKNESLDWIHSFFPINNTEMQINQFQLLVDPSNQLTWTEPARNIEKMEKAVIGGLTTEGENLYIGRTTKYGSSICGKIVPSLHTLFFTWHHKIEQTQDFQILVYRT